MPERGIISRSQRRLPTGAEPLSSSVHITSMTSPALRVVLISRDAVTFSPLLTVVELFTITIVGLNALQQQRQHITSLAAANKEKRHGAQFQMFGMVKRSHNIVNIGQLFHFQFREKVAPMRLRPSSPPSTTPAVGSFARHRARSAASQRRNGWRQKAGQ